MDQKYTKLRPIGYGSYSTIFLVKDNRTNQLSAVKIIPSESNAPSDVLKAV